MSVLSQSYIVEKVRNWKSGICVKVNSRTEAYEDRYGGSIFINLRCAFIICFEMYYIVFKVYEHEYMNMSPIIPQ